MKPVKMTEVLLVEEQDGLNVLEPGELDIATHRQNDIHQQRLQGTNTRLIGPMAYYSFTCSKKRQRNVLFPILAFIFIVAVVVLGLSIRKNMINGERNHEASKTLGNKPYEKPVMPRGNRKKHPIGPDHPDAKPHDPSLGRGHRTNDAPEQAPDTFKVQFITDVKGLTQFNNFIELTVGADHFYRLVKSGFYIDSPWFRVVPKFVVQWGIAGVPAVNAKWSTPITDDPIGVKSNVAGTVSYATGGPNTRTTQLFINYVNNARLDSMGFTPFAYVSQGMAVAEAIYNPTPGNDGGVDQGNLTNIGNVWTKKMYPNINWITNTTLIE